MTATAFYSDPLFQRVQYGPVAQLPTNPQDYPVGFRYLTTDTQDRFVVQQDDSGPLPIRTWQKEATPIGSAGILGFGNGNAGNGAGTRFMDPWYNNSNAGLIEVGIAVRPGTVLRLRVRCVVAAVGSDVVYTVRKNGTDTLLSVTLHAGDNSGSDLNPAHAFTTVDGDVVSLSANKLGAGSGAVKFTATMEIA